MTVAGEHTKLSILEMGLTLWRVDPAYVTARRIAKELNISHGTILHHFPAGERPLKNAIAYHAVKQGDAKVIVHLIAGNHKAVSHMDDTARLEYMRLSRTN